MGKISKQKVWGFFSPCSVCLVCFVEGGMKCHGWLSLAGGQKIFLATLLKVQVSGTVQPASGAAFSSKAIGTAIFH